MYIIGTVNSSIIHPAFQPALEIMEKENAILQDRPRSIAVQETLCRNMRMLMMRAGERYKRFRRYGVFRHPLILLDPEAILSFEEPYNPSSILESYRRISRCKSRMP